MGKILRIYNDFDRDAALEEINLLLHAPDGSPEADRLHALTILVHTYETERHPIYPPSPEEAARFRRDQS